VGATVVVADANGAVVCFDQALGDGEPEAGTVAGGAGGVASVGDLENVGEVAVGYAAARCRGWSRRRRRDHVLP
jgi:hypothetical protein